MSEREKILGCKVDLITDEDNDNIQVATITDRHNRVVRLVVKNSHALTIETAYLHYSQYQWINEAIHVGLKELAEMGKIAQYLINKEEE